MASLSPTRRLQLQTAFLFVFDSFATDKSSVAEFLGCSKPSALTILHRLETAGLVGSVDPNEEAQGRFRRGGFQELTWQAWHTYDDTSREEAVGHFDTAFPQSQDVVPSPAAADGSQIESDSDSLVQRDLEGHPGPVATPTIRRSPKMSKEITSWKTLPASEKLAFLLDHQTIPDSAHTELKREGKEKRSEFLNRIYGAAADQDLADKADAKAAAKAERAAKKAAKAAQA